MGRWTRTDQREYQRIYYRNIHEDEFNKKKFRSKKKQKDKKILNETSLQKFSTFVGKNSKNDENTDLKMYIDDVGLKNYEVSFAKDDNKKVCYNKNAKGFFLFHYKKKQNIKYINIKNYLSIEDGKIKPLQKMTSKQIYDIAKKISEDIYLLVMHENGKEIVVPMPKWVAEAVFKNGAKIGLNVNNHIEKVIDKDGKQITPPKDDIIAQLQDLFGKNVTCDFPYTYIDTIIHKRIMTYKHRIKKKNGKMKTLISQYTNELTGMEYGNKKAKRLERFIKKVRSAWLKTRRIKDRNYLFTGSYQLLNEKHMVSFCIVVKKNKFFVYMINANGLGQAMEKYALPVKRAFEHYIDKYIPEISDRVKYRYVSHNTQWGPTCLTHADYITRHLAKDPNASFDGKGVDPMKICFQALQRAIAVDGLYKPVKEAEKFIPDDIDKLEKKDIVNANSKINKNVRDFFKFNNYNRMKYKLENYQPLLNKKDKNKATNKMKIMNKYNRYQVNKQNNISRQNIRDYYRINTIKRG